MPENSKIEWNRSMIRMLRDIPHTSHRISKLQSEMSEILILDDYDPKGNSYCGTFREVGGIVYQLAKGYGKDRRAKEMAMVEAYFQREHNNKYARTMRVIYGPSKGTWACYVSLCNRGE